MKNCEAWTERTGGVPAIEQSHKLVSLFSWSYQVPLPANCQQGTSYLFGLLKFRDIQDAFHRGTSQQAHCGAVMDMCTCLFMWQRESGGVGRS